MILLYRYFLFAIFWTGLNCMSSQSMKNGDDNETMEKREPPAFGNTPSDHSWSSLKSSDSSGDGMPFVNHYGSVRYKTRYLSPSDKRNPLYSFGLGKRVPDTRDPLEWDYAKRSSSIPRFGFGLGKRGHGDLISLDDMKLDDVDLNENENQKTEGELFNEIASLTSDSSEEDSETDYNLEQKRNPIPVRGYYTVFISSPYQQHGDSYPFPLNTDRHLLEFKKRGKYPSRLNSTPLLGKRLPVYNFGLGKRNSQ